MRETLLKGRGLLETVRSRCMTLLCCWWEVYAKARSGSTRVGLLTDMSNSTPSIVPTDDRTVYLVLDDFVDLGQCWRETAIEGTDFETVINDLLGGEYYNPVRVIGFNTAEGWSRDVSGDVACELRRRCALQLHELPQNILEFVQQHEPRTNRNQQQLV